MNTLAPYREVVKWRKRFWFAVLVDVLLSGVLLSAMGFTWR